MYGILFHAQAWFLIYGFYKDSPALILTNFLCAIQTCSILLLGLKYRGVLDKLCMNIKLKFYEWSMVIPTFF